MSTTKNLFITRRSILTAAALGGLSLITPNGAFADGYNSETVEFLAFPDLSESDVEAIVRQRAEQEAALIIEEAMSSDGVEPYATRGRPSYSTVYGSVQTKASGWHDVAGQPPGGRSHRRGRFHKRPAVWRRFGECIGAAPERSRKHRRIDTAGKAQSVGDWVFHSHRRCRLLESDGERRAQGSAVCCLRNRQRRQEGVQKSSDE